MKERFLFTFLFHLCAISLILIPDKYQGSVVTAILSIPIRTVDAVAIVLIFAGSAFLFGSLFAFLKKQKKLTRLVPPDNGVDKTQ